MFPFRSSISTICFLQCSTLLHSIQYSISAIQKFKIAFHIFHFGSTHITLRLISSQYLHYNLGLWCRNRVHNFTLLNEVNETGRFYTKTDDEAYTKLKFYFLTFVYMVSVFSTIQEDEYKTQFFQFSQSYLNVY